ncbi:heparin lyase I family protein [Tunicatimonas pelagia]|uniref:heparin lyase I family protein n=1 Tax=Tunicatimonas pelagia TaxID=931531 RepID=UPI002666C802|nr:heparin lyase I family protein [Tunicatimonas pelagia]WKN44948.1 heparin lyase I family protein [Tunicatimonas pelagia]
MRHFTKGGLYLSIIGSFLLLSFMLPQAHSQSIEFSYDYENGLPPSGARSGDGSFSSKTSSTLPGSNRSMEHFISNSDERAEIRGIDNGIIVPGEDWWYVVSYYFPTGWHTATPGEPTYTILNQLSYQGATQDQGNCRTTFACNRQISGGCTRGAPASELTVDPAGNQFTYTIKYYTGESGGKSRFECDKINFSAGLNQWHTIVWHVVLAPSGGNGLIEMWHNGNQIFSRNQSVNRPGARNSEWKYGAYVGDPNHGTRRVITDGFYAGEGYSNLNQFLSATPYGGTTPPDPDPDPDPQPCDGDNLARGGSIHSVSGQQAGNEANKLIDGVSDTDANRWSANGYPQWVILDLGSEQSVEGVRLQAIQDRTYRYEVYASQSLSEVQNKSASSRVVSSTTQPSASFATVSARYLRVEVSGAEGYSGSWVSLREVEVQGSCSEEGGNEGEGQISIRAKGDCGSETMVLRIDGEEVERWDVSTSFADYSFAGYSGGEVVVAFVNDEVSPCDRNLEVDYIDVCGVRYQTETDAVETATCCLNRPDKLFTDGDFNFGDVGCGSNARQSSEVSKVSLFGEVTSPLESEWLVYPNPASGQLIIEGEDEYQVVVHDVNGQQVMQHRQSGRKARLDISHLRPGIYFLKMQGQQGYQLRRKVIVQ